MEYLTLLLNTYIVQKEIFSEVIKNRQLDFENNKSISKKEFYFNCNKVIKNLKSEVDNKYFERIKELYLISDLREAKGEPITDIEDEIEDTHRNHFPINLLHLTGDTFRGNLYLNEIEFIEKCINENQYISLNEKLEIFTNTAFFYSELRFNKDNLKGVFSKHYETKDDFLKTLYSENTRIFFRSAIIQKNEDFVKSINNEFMLFCTYNSVTTEIKESWLKKTYQFITKVNDLSEFIDKPTVCLFVNWYNETIKTLKNETTDLKDISTTENNYLGQPTNENANLFFEFLCEHYRPEDKTQVKYVNILYYLKNDAEKKHFIYKVKQKDYKKLIESKGIKISKFDKSANYLEVEKPIFYKLENTFLKNKTV